MRWALGTAILLFSLLSGCSGDDGGDASSSATSGATSGSQSSSGSGTTGAPANRTLTFGAPVLSGSTPLNVTFSLGATGTDSKTQWRLVFGDGGQAQTGKGTIPPAITHVYSVGGNFTATFNVTYDDGQRLGKALEIEAIAPAPPAAPDPAEFSLGPSAGCFGDFVGEEQCISFGMGPGSDPIDGHWVPLDERYWGYSFTSDTTLNPDSDCVFVAEDETTILGEGNNGGATCQGTVPDLTAWLYIYPYGAGDPGMTVTFDV